MDNSKHVGTFQRKITAEEERRRQSRIRGPERIWIGFATFGRIGWSIVAPAVAGALLGSWLDSRLPAPFSWTVTLLFSGMGLGCWSAWQWVADEHALIKRDNEKNGPADD